MTGEPTVDKRGHRHSPHPTLSETTRRDDMLIAAFRRGYSHRVIANALGISSSTVSNVVNARGEHRSPALRAPTEPLVLPDWHDDAQPAVPLPKVRPLYQSSTTLMLLGSILREFRNDNAENRFAHDVADAVRAGDADWLTRAEQTLGEVDDFLRRLRQITVDQGYRERVMVDRSSGREGLARLYVVGGS